MTKLTEAVGRGDAFAVEEILGEEEYDDRSLIDKKTDERGWNALYIAVSNNNIEIVELLLNEGAKVNQVFKNGLTPLHAVTFFDRPNTLKALLKRTDVEVDPRNAKGCTPLYIATDKPRVDLEVILALLNKDANCRAKANDGSTPLDIAKKKGHTELVKIFEDYILKGKSTPLGNSSGLAILPKPDQDEIFSLNSIDIEGQTNNVFFSPPPSLLFSDKLTSAITMGDIRRVKEICNGEINININKTDSKKRSPLLVALEKLLSKQFEVGILEYDKADETFGHLTSPDDQNDHFQRVEIVKFLLSQGASVLEKNSKGFTAVSVAREISEKSCSIYKIVKRHKKIELLKEKFIKFRDSVEQNFIDIKSIDVFFMEKYRLNVLHDGENFKEENESFSKIEGMMEIIKNKKYMKWSLLKTYEILWIIQTDNYDFKVNIEERFDRRYIKEDENSYYYTFMDNKLYRLTQISITDEKNSDEDAILKTIICQLMTTLTYEGKRYGWNSESVQLHHNLIGKLDSKYLGHNLKSYEEDLIKIEKDEKNYFSENISDNSDSEAEEKYKNLPLREKRLFFQYAEKLISRAQPECLTTKKGELRKFEKKNVGKPENEKSNKNKNKKRFIPSYNIEKRQEIIREDELPLQVKRDLEKLNTFAIKGELNTETIKEISTKFYIAQFRGVCYRLDEWSKPSRELHRKKNEINNPLFSRAVLEEGGYQSFHEYLREKNEKILNTLTKISANLQDQLIQLKETGPVKVQLIGEEKRRFEDALQALQDFYTKDYEKFHVFLEGKSSIEDPIQRAMLASINNHRNFLVSTSDVPDHALRYAYGKKYYGPYNKQFRLRPRWDKNGRPERPYSGKVYISLHEPIELFTISHHVVSLNEQSKISIDLQTIPERETSFFSYIPENRVISQHIAKFPSFHGDYKEIYLKKYGLDKNLYTKFKNAILSSPPHEEKRKFFINMLSQHLISYQEVCLIEEARIAAKEKGGILIYRSKFGGFSLLPCEFKEIRKPTDTNLQLASTKSLEAKKDKQEKRKREEDKPVGFISTLSDKFYFYEIGGLTNILSSFLNKPTEEIENLIKKIEKWEEQSVFSKTKAVDIIDFYNRSCALLKLLARDCNVAFKIYNPLLNGGYQEIKNTDLPEKILNLYFVGGQKFIELREKNMTYLFKNTLKDKSSGSLKREREDSDFQGPTSTSTPATDVTKKFKSGPM